MELKDLIRKRRAEIGKTLEEISQEVGVSKATVQKWESGAITDIRRGKLVDLAKALQTTPAYLMGWEPEAVKIDNASYVGPLDDDFVIYNVIGSIAAGYDGRAIEEPTGDVLQVPRSLLRGHDPKDFMVLRVHGNSMAPQLLDGDWAVIKRCTSVDSGSIAVLLYNGEEATIKRVRYVNGEDWLELIPANPDYPVKRIEDSDLEQCRVLGKVVNMIRNFD